MGENNIKKILLDEKKEREREEGKIKKESERKRK